MDILKRGELELRGGVRDLIDAAVRAGIRVAVATTTSRANVEALTQCCWGKPADEVFEVSEGDAVYIPGQVPHSYQAGEEGFEFICVVPNKEDRIDIVDPES